MLIRNRAEIATNERRQQVLALIETGIAAVLPPVVMRAAVKYDARKRTLVVNGASYSLCKGRVFVVGGGKAAGAMATALESIISPENITAGVVNCNCRSTDYPTKKIKVVEASHPLPDGRGVRGVRAMLSLKTRYNIGADDTVICLVSGGGSALMPQPVGGISLEDKQKMTRLLLSCGAEIGEINTVRKHLSRVKGGRLGQFFAPGKVISLIISDVVGNDLNTIASGLTCPDATTYQDAWDVVSRYDLLAAAPPGVIAFLSRGCRNEIEETPKALGNCHNHIIGDNRLALEAMARQAEAMGLRPHIVTAAQKGDTAGVARLRAEEVREGKYAGYGVVLIGGETTPSLPPSPGWGGRNQHYVAVSLLAMQNFPGGWVIASVGTDGTDYLPEVAGAIIDDDSFAEARACGLDVPSYVERFDSYNLLARMGKSLLVMGNTGTNVGDIIVYRLR